jgi:Acetyltransferase (GNAT) domain
MIVTTTQPSPSLAPLKSVASPAPRDQWQAVVDSDPRAIVTQTPLWTTAMIETGNFVDRSRMYEFDDGRRFILPLARRKGPAGAVLGDQGFPNGWGIGGLVGQGLDPHVVKAVFAELGESGISRVQIRPNPLDGEEYRQGAPTRSIALYRRAHVIDLRGGTEDVWQRFSKAARRGVRKGEKAGLEVEDGHGEQLVREYYSLHLKSVERWAGQQHEPLALAKFRAEHRDGLAKWITIARVLGPQCRISVARLNGQAVGATVVLCGPNGHETRSAFDRDLIQGSDPTYLLTWLGICESVRRGAHWYHLGETGTSLRLADFKERFAAVGYDYADYRLERFPVTRADRLVRGVVKRAIRFRD